MRGFNCSDFEKLSLPDLKDLVKKSGAEKALEKVLKRASRTHATKRDYCEALVRFNKGVDAKKLIAGVSSGAGALALLGTGAVALQKHRQKQRENVIHGMQRSSGLCKTGKLIPNDKLGTHKEMHEYCKKAYGSRHVAYTEYPEDAHKYDVGIAPSSCCKELDVNTDREVYLKNLDRQDLQVNQFLVKELDRTKASLDEIMKVMKKCSEDQFCDITEEKSKNIKSAWNVYITALSHHINLLIDSKCDTHKCIDLNTLRGIVEKNVDQLVRMKELFITILENAMNEPKTFTGHVNYFFMWMYNSAYKLGAYIWSWRLTIGMSFLALDVFTGIGDAYISSWGDDPTAGWTRALSTIKDRVCYYATRNALVGAIAIEAFLGKFIQTRHDTFKSIFMMVKVTPTIATSIAVAVMTGLTTTLSSVVSTLYSLSSMGMGVSSLFSAASALFISTGRKAPVTIYDIKDKIISFLKKKWGELPNEFEGKSMDDKSWEHKITELIIYHCNISRIGFYAVFCWLVSMVKSLAQITCFVQSNVSSVMTSFWDVVTYPFREKNTELNHILNKQIVRAVGDTMYVINKVGHNAIEVFESVYSVDLPFTDVTVGQTMSTVTALTIICGGIVQYSSQYWENVCITEDLFETMTSAHEDLSNRMNNPDKKVHFPKLVGLEKNETFQGKIKELENLLPQKDDTKEKEQPQEQESFFFSMK